ncbi:hypothetical protein C0J52_04632 [Blattella germanica]|nr:hypothetical protein C0J52_04632 [Blattella germanica]
MRNSVASYFVLSGLWILASSQQVTLQLPGLGFLQGTLNYTAWSLRTVYQFQGIPFAKPPLGDLRFKPPEPSGPWHGALDASKFRRKCPVMQRSHQETDKKEWARLLNDTDIEDCLHLNVYTTKLGIQNNSLPVMVYFHGGSFRVGSAQEFWPTFLLERDVVLVVPQYRLGPLGLFTQVIAQSGSALGTWVMDENPLRSARSIAKLANCTQEDVQDLTDCLKNISAQQLLVAHSNFLIEDLLAGGRGTGGNHPVIQTAGSQKFLVEPPLKSIHEGRFIHVPLMGGVTRHEGSFIVGSIEDPTGMVADILNERYFKPGQLGDFKAMTPGLIDICGVALLKAATYRSVLENSRHEPSFLYSFNYYGEHTKFGYGEDVDYPFPGGVSHSDDLIYLFPQPGLVFNDKDREISQMMVELWTNFATYGKPAPAMGVPHWPPMGTETGPYLRIERESTVRENFIDEYTIAVTGGLGPHTSIAPTTSVTILLLLVTIIPIL